MPFSHTSTSKMIHSHHGTDIVRHVRLTLNEISNCGEGIIILGVSMSYALDLGRLHLMRHG
jgi:hypothetical protein